MAPVAFLCLNWEQSGMETPIVESQDGITLVGAGPVARGALGRALALAPRLVAADGGANRLLRLGHLPEAVIGDLDSLSAPARDRLAGRLHRVADQDTTDFDKALAAVSAPFILGLGFWGARIDHGLSALSGLLRQPERRCVLLGGGDAVCLAPPRLTLTLPARARVSLFPLVPLQGRSQGLRWPIDGLTLAPGGMVGTSNAAVGGAVRLEFDRPGMLLILGAQHLPELLRAFAAPTDARGG